MMMVMMVSCVGGMFVVMMELVLISRDICDDDCDDGKLCWW